MSKILPLAKVMGLAHLDNNHLSLFINLAENELITD